MSTEVPAVSTAGTDVPQIVVTEPSPLILGTVSVTSHPVQEKENENLTKEGYTGELPTCPGQTETNGSNPGQTSSAPEQEKDSSGEFSPAEDCTECIVSVPEVAVSEQAEPTTGSSMSDPDEFRTAYGCCHLNLDYEGPYQYLWNILESRYAIPFWLLAIALPVSAGIMGAVYMFSCPAADSLPNMVFMIGISLMAVFTLRICVIIHRATWADENSRSMLQTMNLICLFMTSLFFITESATFYQMKPSTHPGAKDFCHPTFSTFVFWWNIAMSVLMSILMTFPIA